jgi:hypothetical protein
LFVITEWLQDKPQEQVDEYHDEFFNNSHGDVNANRSVDDIES